MMMYPSSTLLTWYSALSVTQETTNRLTIRLHYSLSIAAGTSFALQSDTSPSRHGHFNLGLALNKRQDLGTNYCLCIDSTSPTQDADETLTQEVCNRRGLGQYSVIILGKNGENSFGVVSFVTNAQLENVSYSTSLMMRAVFQ